jgi:hypothetical protein
VNPPRTLLSERQRFHAYQSEITRNNCARAPA